jgi:hypothetical protein
MNAMSAMGYTCCCGFLQQNKFKIGHHNRTSGRDVKNVNSETDDDLSMTFFNTRGGAFEGFSFTTYSQYKEVDFMLRGECPHKQRSVVPVPSVQ